MTFQPPGSFRNTTVRLEGVSSAPRWKLTTATQLVTVGTVLLLNALNNPMPVLIQGLVWLTLAMTLSSGLHYIYHAARLAEGPPESGGPGPPPA